VYSIYVVRYLIVTVYVISVIMMEEKIPYTALSYLVNRIWHTVCCAL